MEKFHRCIVVDSLGKPMAFDEKRKQFIYCNSMKRKATKRSTIHPLRSYEIKHVNKFIEQHIATRKERGWDTEEIMIIPFKD